MFPLKNTRRYQPVEVQDSWSEKKKRLTVHVCMHVARSKVREKDFSRCAAEIRTLVMDVKHIVKIASKVF